MKISWKKRKTSVTGTTGAGGGGGEMIGGKKRPNRNVLLAFDEAGVDEAATGAEEDKTQKQQQQGEKIPGEQTIDSEAHGDFHRLAESFRAQGNLLAEEGRYHEALGKWEAALNLAPENAVLHEQKAQVLLEVGDAWNALRAAKRCNEILASHKSYHYPDFAAGATELEPSWSEVTDPHERRNDLGTVSGKLSWISDLFRLVAKAWVTLGRAQLNFGEPDLAVESLDKTLAIKPDHKEAQADRSTAVHLIKKRKLIELSDPSFADKRYKVRDSTDM